jgi:sarcosine oxidase subunit alpha
MTAPYRAKAGGRIDRKAPLVFTFDGVAYPGFVGDTLASALIANGVHLVGRSFKYHRPRGIVSAGSDEPNALVEVRRDSARVTPNLRATEVELYDGLEAHSQNRFPSLGFDLGAINDVLWPLFPAGFYYKTFMWPASFWEKVYEPNIRAMAGLGKSPTEADPDRYTQRFAHAEVLVVGAGPAGLSAALAAAASGVRVILCDEQAELGGSLLTASTELIDGQPAADWVAAAVATLKAAANVTLLPRTTAFGYTPHNLIALAERVTDHLGHPDPKLPRERLWQVRAAEVVIATGAHERPLVFPDNDRPGILLAGAGRTYVNRYGALPGSHAVVVTAHDSAYRTAIDLVKAGVAIEAIIDVRPSPEGPHYAAAKTRGLKILTGHTVCGVKGSKRVQGVDVAPVTNGAVGALTHLHADVVLMSGGWTPSLHLFSQSRGKIAWDPALNAFLPATPAERCQSAGSCRGVFDLDAVIADGHLTGVAAAKGEVVDPGLCPAAGGQAGVIGELPHHRKPTAVRAFVDYQNDVTAKDIHLAVREGFHSIEHVKRYTTTGMATDQGKTSNINALGIVAESLGKQVPEIGLTTFRMPYTPTTFGTLAGVSRGDLFDPVRRTATHDWAVEHGAVFEDVGQWKRVHYFPKGAEDLHEAVDRECLAVRGSVGMFDASTLGKIEVVGADAAEFLNRMYVNSWTNLAPGRCRYGILLAEDGAIIDDGVIGRLAPDRFHVTTTTGGAPRVLNMMEDYRQTEWPDLDVWLTSTSEQWSVVAVQGPNSRKVVEALVEGIDVAAMPHMSVRDGTFQGVPARLFRVSFTGELGFEINVPGEYGRALWEAVYAAGAPYGITPYGTEAMHVLRAEKGYIIVGQDTDGTVYPDDAGLTWAIGKNKPDFVGKRSLARPLMSAPDRKQLVGLLTEDPHVVLEEGAQVVLEPNHTIPAPMIGHVTSSYHSAVLGRSIALAVVRNGRGRIGEKLYVAANGATNRVEVVKPVFYDPEGGRLNG